MMLQAVPLFFFVCWLSLSGAFEAKPQVSISSNGTSLELGQSVRLTCQLENFTQGKEDYEVFFYLNNSDDYVSHYYVSAPDSSGHRDTVFNNETSRQPSIGRHPVSSTFPVYEITVTPTIAGTSEYWCNLFRNPTIDVYSKHLSITARR